MSLSEITSIPYWYHIFWMFLITKIKLDVLFFLSQSFSKSICNYYLGCMKYLMVAFQSRDQLYMEINLFLFETKCIKCNSNAAMDAHFSKKMSFVVFESVIYDNEVFKFVQCVMHHQNKMLRIYI